MSLADAFRHEKFQNRETAVVMYSIMATHTHPFNGSLSGTTQVSRYQKGKTNVDFTEARDSEWQWHQLGYMQVCTSLQTDNHTSSPPLLCFFSVMACGNYIATISFMAELNSQWQIYCYCSLSLQFFNEEVICGNSFYSLQFEFRFAVCIFGAYGH